MANVAVEELFGRVPPKAYFELLHRFDSFLIESRCSKVSYQASVGHYNRSEGLITFWSQASICLNSDLQNILSRDTLHFRTIAVLIA